jgi:hypothetical protein
VVVQITCPRCGGGAEVERYGPCEPCRGQLRATIRGVAREAGDTTFEPAMNVTPNAVALKDD